MEVNLRIEFNRNLFKLKISNTILIEIISNIEILNEDNFRQLQLSR